MILAQRLHSWRVGFCLGRRSHPSRLWAFRIYRVILSALVRGVTHRMGTTSLDAATLMAASVRSPRQRRSNAAGDEHSSCRTYSARCLSAATDTLSREVVMTDFRRHEDYLLDVISDLMRDHANQIEYLVTMLTIAHEQDAEQMRTLIGQVLRELKPAWLPLVRVGAD